jgi:two-component system LytT family sensor kinase
MESSSIRPNGVIGLSLAVGVFFTGQTVFMALAAGRPLMLELDVWQELLYWSVWALIAPRILEFATRWPLDTVPIRRAVVIHVVLSVVVTGVQTVVAFSLPVLASWIAGAVPTDDVLRVLTRRSSAMVWGVFMGVPFYWAILGLYTTYRFRGRSAALAAELARSQLDALRSQLRPHFLFNTLNAISVLTVDDPDKARRMLLRLGSLLRRSLDEEKHEIPLREELSFLDDYLDIQRVRFGDRLVVTIAIDPAAQDARVPVLMLQPLVENAIEHGAPDGDATTSITLRATPVDNTLRLTIEDNGPGTRVNGPPREGIGLRNTRERLRTLYGDRARIELANGTAGARVEVTIPLSSST